MIKTDWFEEALELYNRGFGYRSIAKKLDIKVKTVESRFVAYKKRNGIKLGVRDIVVSTPKDVVKPSNKEFKQEESKVDNIMFIPEETEFIPKQDSLEIDKNGHHTSTKLLQLSNEQKKSPKYLIEAHGYDSKEWELLNVRNNIWNSYSKKDGIMELYSSKVVLKPLVKGVSLEDIQAHFDNYKPTFIGAKHPKTETNEIFELPMFDLHVGKFSWGPESGENFDHRILKERYHQITSEILSKIEGRKFDYILLPLGQDLLNTDNIEGNTTGGTPQDSDVRWAKMFDIAAELFVDLISTLQKIAPVQVLLIPGNHSKVSEFYIVKYLQAYFRLCDTITFDSRPIRRKYVEYGNCLIGYTHGDTEKKRIDYLMSVEAKEAWGRTLYKEFHLGHLHSEQTRETAGQIIRNLSSITSTDAWHFNSGFIGAIKKIQCFVWSKQYGVMEILHFVVKDNN